VSFVDTNVLVYASVEGAPLQEKARSALVRVAREGATRISRQILREYLAVVTRSQTWGKPLALAAAVSDAETFANRFQVLEEGQETWAMLCHLSQHCDFAGRQVHDANIVATMLAHGERRLLTFNVGDFRRFEPLIELMVP
jgi:predicted nucleic acid-binding protein